MRNLNSGVRGKISQYLAGCWLMNNGYDVYAQAGVNKFDFIVEKDGKLETVEVKTAPKLQAFPLMWKTNPDMLVLVSYTGAVRAIQKNN